MYGPSHINSFYGLRDVGQGEYENYLDNVDYKEVIEVLIVEGLSGIQSMGDINLLKLSI